MAKTIAQALLTAAFLALFGQAGKPVPPSTPYQSNSPALSESQKLEIRNAQVEYFAAKSVLESSPAYQAVQNAQAKLNETVRRIQKDTGCEPPKYQLGGDLARAARLHHQRRKLRRKSNGRANPTRET
jgi:hypothetical protein